MQATSVENPIFHVAAQQINNHLVKAQQIARDTAQDKTLSKVMTYTQHGTWPFEECNEPDVKPYFNWRNKLYVEQGCLMW